jgi:hypothetical protein
MCPCGAADPFRAAEIGVVYWVTEHDGRLARRQADGDVEGECYSRGRPSPASCSGPDLGCGQRFAVALVDSGRGSRAAVTAGERHGRECFRQRLSSKPESGDSHPTQPRNRSRKPWRVASQSGDGRARYVAGGCRSTGAAVCRADLARSHWAHLGASAHQWPRPLPLGARHRRDALRDHCAGRGQPGDPACRRYHSASDGRNGIGGRSDRRGRSDGSG